MNSVGSLRGDLNLPADNIHVVDDEPRILDSLAFKLEACGYHVSCYSTGEAFLDAVDQDTRGCAIIDVHLPGVSGLKVLEALSSIASRVAAVIVTGQGDVEMAVKAMRLGAADFIEKPFADGAITAAVRYALSTASAGQFMQRETAAVAARKTSLTRREREVFDGLVSGKLSKQVAIDLGISPRTVEVHRSHIMTKMGASTQSELLRLGLLAEIHNGSRQCQS